MSDPNHKSASDAPDISIVIPCYNSSNHLGELIDRLRTTMDATGAAYEVVLVNDASPDDTWALIQSLSATDTRITGIDLMRNVGQFAALLCGLDASRGSVVVTMDDDLQHAPEDVPTLVAALDGAPETDVVIAAFADKAHGFIRRSGSALMDRIFRLAYQKPPDLKMSSFRALRRPVVDGMLAFGTVRPIPGALLLRTTTRIVNVPVQHHDRASGKSGYRPGRLVGSTFDNIINSSTLPLRLFSSVGLVLSILALVVFVFYLLRALFGTRGVPGFSTLVLLVIFFGGAIMLAVGILGEYVGRVVVETTRPPLYRVRSRTSDDSPAG